MERKKEERMERRKVGLKEGVYERRSIWRENYMKEGMKEGNII